MEGKIARQPGCLPEIAFSPLITIELDDRRCIQSSLCPHGSSDGVVDCRYYRGCNAHNAYGSAI